MRAKNSEILNSPLVQVANEPGFGEASRDMASLR